ncbi:MAG: cytoplasmic protein [Desulfosoma sp.]|uniref:cytoplasmic protein n=1 Tax=Desulfosoma sp. TaxID=2603217 RepID=UPI004049D3BA
MVKVDRYAGQYQDFHATALYCPRCRQAMPVRCRLLLVLPDGELHEYLCAVCGTSVGTKTVRQEREARILIP